MLAWRCVPGSVNEMKVFPWNLPNAPWILDPKDSFKSFMLYLSGIFSKKTADVTMLNVKKTKSKCAEVIHSPIASYSDLPEGAIRNSATSAMTHSPFFSAILLLCLCSVAVLANSIDGFTLGVRDSIMIAHSFTGEAFGPAQNLHGATYTVDVELSTADLVEKVNWVIDIGDFSSMLSEVLNAYNFKNLNDIFPEENTTTEFMCRRIHQDIAAKLKCKSLKAALSVKLHESHKAWASYSHSIE